MSSEQHRRVLFVDDEPHVLEGLERMLFDSDFEVLTAPSGAAGLARIEQDGPIAVVVSDMRMPEMDGAAFLSKARLLAPDSVRMLLTGYADIDAAIAAVNKGNIFRFLCKPCPEDVLSGALQAAAEQYRLVTAERELLERTLKGAVKVLTEVLAITSPAAFSRASQIRTYVRHMAERLNLPAPWRFELAAMLSQLGCITLPPELLDRLYAGQTVSAAEQQMFEQHSEVGQRLLQHIPRLEQVAAIIGGQTAKRAALSSEERLGVAMLQVAFAVDELVINGMSIADATSELARQGKHHSRLVSALSDCHEHERGEVIQAVQVRELTSFMVLDHDVRSIKGNVVVAAGRELSAPLIERIKNFHKSVGIQEPVRVRVAGVTTRRRVVATAESWDWELEL